MATILDIKLLAAISRSLIDFGYPDATLAVVREIYDAWKDGKRGADLPHGVIGRFAEDQFQQAVNALEGHR